MNFKEKIEDYAELVNDFDLSPFESIDGLHVRDRIQESFDELTDEEKKLLLSYDLQLLVNVSAVYAHLSKAFDFSRNKPSNGWWWRLNELKDINIYEVFQYYADTRTKDLLA